MIPNGNTLVMGGLVQDEPTASYTKVPFLGDIPVLGWAFHSESKTMSKDNLIIFLTPTIVKDADFQPTDDNFPAVKTQNHAFAHEPAQAVGRGGTGCRKRLGQSGAVAGRI